MDIVAHENTKANMAKMDAFKGDKAQFLPKRTFKDKLTIGSGKDRIDLYYFGAGHTNGDTLVVYPALRVLQTGDLFAWKDAPLHRSRQRRQRRRIPADARQGASPAIKNVDTVIPGHSPVMKWSELQEYQRYMADLLAEVQTARSRLARTRTMRRRRSS